MKAIGKLFTVIVIIVALVAMVLLPAIFFDVFAPKMEKQEGQVTKVMFDLGFEVQYTDNYRFYTAYINILHGEDIHLEFDVEVNNITRALASLAFQKPSTLFITEKRPTLEVTFPDNVVDYEMNYTEYEFTDVIVYIYNFDINTPLGMGSSEYDDNYADMWIWRTIDANDTVDATTISNKVHTSDQGTGKWEMDIHIPAFFTPQMFWEFSYHNYTLQNVTPNVEPEDV